MTPLQILQIECPRIKYVLMKKVALERFLVSMQLAVNIHAESLPMGIFPEILNTAIIRSETNSFDLF